MGISQASVSRRLQKMVLCWLNDFVYCYFKEKRITGQLPGTDNAF